jgi:outer membrane protein assembly factor BamD
MLMRTLLLIMIGVLLLQGCAFTPEEEDETKGWSANRLYSQAKGALNGGDYENAIRYYEILESRYPFGKYAAQGQIDIAYAYYKYDEPESAIAAADRFIKLHPNHPHVDYAHYLKGLIYFNREIGFLARMFEQEAATRDPSSARQAFQEFTALLKKYPNSRYAPDSRLRALYLRNNLANHELHVARFYLKRKAYVAAVTRCQYLLENYDQSTAVPDALIIMAMAYDEMGMKKLADDARRVLATSFPEKKELSETRRAWWNPF